MRVVYVSTLARGGPVSHLLDLAPAVTAAGAEVRVVCGDEAVVERFRRLGLEARAAPIATKLDLRGAASVWPLVDDADVVHTHDRRAGLFGRLAGRMQGARVVHTLHGVPEELVPKLARTDAPPLSGTSEARKLWVEEVILRAERLLTHLGALVSPSEAMARLLVSYGFPRQRIHVIPYGIEVGSAPPRAERPAGPLVVGTAANLEHWKGVDVLVRAASLMRSPVRLEVFGQGALRGELERQARDAGVDARFHGFVPDLRARLAELDVYALPSRGDNLPVSILEAMAAALPVVGTRVGGIPELVADGETGRIVELDDAEGLARALDELAERPEQRLAMGRAGAERVSEHFSAERVARRMIELYERLCASSR
jgi:glycosyltransferase involved in cell wall biosynthesis